MPMPLPNSLLKANDYLMQAISFMQLALDEARNESSRRHALAIKETRVNGLIDAVRYETRIQEALITLRGICEAPGLGITVGGVIPAGDRGTGDPVDHEAGGGDVVAQPRISDGAVATGALSIRDTMQRIAAGQPMEEPAAGGCRPRTLLPGQYQLHQVFYPRRR